MVAASLFKGFEDIDAELCRRVLGRLPKPHVAQQRVIDEAQRFNVIAAGVRFGKSQLAMDRLVNRALQGWPCAWFGTSYKNLAPFWRELKDTLYPATAQVKEQEHSISLIVKGGSIECWSPDNIDAVRGRKYSMVVIDEAAHWPNFEHAWTTVIRQRLTDLRGDAWIISTPRGTSNYFAQMFRRGQDPEFPHWRSWQMPTAANPFIVPEEIEEVRGDLTELAFAQEYLAQFVTWEGAVFRKISDAISDVTHKPQPGRRYVIGVDWGQRNDFTVFCVVDPIENAVVELDRSKGIEYTMQSGRLAALRDRWNKADVIAEENSMGRPIREYLKRDGIPVTPFTTTNATKAAIVEGLALAFERGEIKIPNDPALVGELQAFEASKLPSGLIRYEAPSGQHDDTVIATAIAWEASARGKKRHNLIPISSTPKVPLSSMV